MWPALYRIRSSGRECAASAQRRRFAFFFAPVTGRAVARRPAAAARFFGPRFAAGARFTADARFAAGARFALAAAARFFFGGAAFALRTGRAAGTAATTAVRAA
jgi:hypothetical protein